jgi:hypothetical protein
MFVSVRYSSALLHRSVMAATFGLGSTWRPRTLVPKPRPASILVIIYTVIVTR